MGKKSVAWTAGPRPIRALLTSPLRCASCRPWRYLASGDGDVKRLQDIEPPELRLRAGDYRVRFLDHRDSILVLSVGHRSEACR